MEEEMDEIGGVQSAEKKAAAILAKASSDSKLILEEATKKASAIVATAISRSEAHTQIEIKNETEKLNAYKKARQSTALREAAKIRGMKIPKGKVDRILRRITNLIIGA
ncbi:MAG: hypothetical protein ACP5UH_01005 [Candidatus Micrarchaeia archaeon]